MAGSAELIGRERERRVLSDRLDRAAAGEGGLLLVAGEAGVGKTSLAEAAVADCALLVLRGVVSDQGRTPYSPIVATLRAYDRIAPGALGGSGHLSRHLSVLLPELGPAPRVVDHLALAEALREAFVGMAVRQPTVVFLDDLHWSHEPPDASFASACAPSCSCWRTAYTLMVRQIAGPGVDRRILVWSTV